MLDKIVRFVGQRVAAVVAESEGAAEAGCRKLDVDYEVLPAVFDPEKAMRPGAPVIHDKGPESRIANPQRNIAGEIHGHVGNVEEGFAQGRRRATKAPTSPSASSTRIWKPIAPSAGSTKRRRLNVRSSTQTPFLTRRALAGLFDLDPAKVRVFCERMGGGFGAKQEMLVEDVVALAVLKTGRPVKLEFTREEQFIAATTRHPMRVRIKAGARRDGRLTAMEMHVVSNTGAYGNHGPAVLYHACGECIAVYNCANKKIDGFAVYTNTVPGRRFSRLRPAADQFRRRVRDGRTGAQLGIGPIEIRARNVVKPGDPMIATGAAEYHEWNTAATASTSASIWSSAPWPRRRLPPPLSDDWLVGEGIALTMIDTVPPSGHIADAPRRLARRRRLRARVGTAEFGNGTTTVHRQIAATALGRPRSKIRVLQSDTDNGGHDTGAYGSAGTFVAGRATKVAGEASREQILCFAAEHAAAPPAACARRRRGGRAPAGARFPNRRGGARKGPKLSPQDDRRHAAFGRLQRAGLSGRREQGHRRDQDSEERAGGGCRAGHQSHAVPRAGRRRRRAVARGCALRGNGDRRGRAHRQSDVSQLPPAVLCRRAAHRSLFRRYLRQDRADRREIDERKPVQSDRRRDGQCARRRHRHPLSDAVQA